MKYTANGYANYLEKMSIEALDSMIKMFPPDVLKKGQIIKVKDFKIYKKGKELIIGKSLANNIRIK